jgi:protein disulfide-isomerase A6
LAKVAAVNCDEDENKPLCEQMGVQGFPTLKIVVPGKKPGKPRVEDYQGQRSAKAIVDAVVDKIPNHVKKLTDKDFDSWTTADESPKAILFTEKGTTSALLRSLAIDFLGVLNLGQVRSKESEAVEKLGITSFPTLVLLPGGEADPITYEGEMKKKPMLEFLSQAAQPNPDPAPSSLKKKKAKGSSKSTGKDSSQQTESPKPNVEVPEEEKPVAVPVKVPEVRELSTPEDLESACLTPKSGTCILALLPETQSPDSELPDGAKEALATVSELSHKLAAHRLPFYTVPSINSYSKVLRSQLGLLEESATELIAVNGRRGWWRHYTQTEKDGFAFHAVESWVDGIRLGEGTKAKLPEGVVIEDKQQDSEDETLAEEKEANHDEL